MASRPSATTSVTVKVALNSGLIEAAGRLAAHAAPRTGSRRARARSPLASAVGAAVIAEQAAAHGRTESQHSIRWAGLERTLGLHRDALGRRSTESEADLPVALAEADQPDVEPPPRAWAPWTVGSVTARAAIATSRPRTGRRHRSRSRGRSRSAERRG